MDKKHSYTISTFFVLLACSLSLGSSAQEVSYVEDCLTQSHAADRYASYSPDGATMLFESDRDGSWSIYTMDLTSQTVRNLTPDAPPCRRPSWHPSGDTVLFEWLEVDHEALVTLDLGTGRVNRVIEFPADATLTFARFSPDGNQIACAYRESSDVSNIVLLNSRGKITRRITNSRHRSFYPQWSSDGSKLVFFSRMETDNLDDDLYTMDLSDGSMARLTKDGGHDFCPTWSNDGRYIVYVKSMEDSRPELFISSVDGQNHRRVTFNEDGETLPSYHPTKDKVLVTAYRDGNYEICELSLRL